VAGDGLAVKMVLVVRTDLDMGRGKIAAQAAHGAVTAALASAGTDDFLRWTGDGQPKVVLRAESADQLASIAARARDAALPVELVHDAGRTQLAAGTVTCCAIGPASGAEIDAVTGGLRLL